jgi:hypothetical protein
MSSKTTTTYNLSDDVKVALSVIGRTISGKTLEESVNYLTAVIYEMARDNNLVTSKPTRIGWDVNDDNLIIGCIMEFGKTRRNIPKAEFAQAIPQKDFAVFSSAWTYIGILTRIILKSVG